MACRLGSAIGVLRTVMLRKLVAIVTFVGALAVARPRPRDHDRDRAHRQPAGALVPGLAMPGRVQDHRLPGQDRRHEEPDAPPVNGRLVAFTLQLAKPDDNQINFFNSNLGARGHPHLCCASNPTRRPTS